MQTKAEEHTFESSAPFPAFGFLLASFLLAGFLSVVFLGIGPMGPVRLVPVQARDPSRT